MATADVLSAATAHPRHARGVRALLFGSWLVAITLGGVAVARDQMSSVSLGVLFAGAVVSCWLLVARMRRGKAVPMFLGVATLVMFPIVPELALRASGFRFESGIKFIYPDERNFVQFVRDPELFWKFDPTHNGINKWGFPGPDVGPKPAGVKRILLLGDSCSAAGYPQAYPQLLQAILAKNRAADKPPIECVSLSIPGYSSHQGRVVAAKYGRLVDPDFVVVYYGWNDHWFAYGSPDARKKLVAPSPGGVADMLYRSSRLLQFLVSLQGADLLQQPRVSADEYRANLNAIAAPFEAAKLPVVFITAPTGYRRLGVDASVMQQHAAIDNETAVRMHGEYTDIVRDVVGAGTPTRYVLDLEREFEALTEEHLREVFMYKGGYDGIHFSARGREIVAERLASYLAEQFGI